MRAWGCCSRSVEAAYSPSKGELLRQAGRRLQALRYLTRLAKDLRLVSVDAYGFAAERADEIGRMMGGWQKQQEGRT